MRYESRPAFDPQPLAIEVRALVNNSKGEPVFTWLTITTSSIECVSPATTESGGGASLRLKTGHQLLLSNSYEDVSEAILGDCKRFPNCEETEAEMLKPPSPEEVEEMLKNQRAAQAAAAGADVGSALGLVENDEDDEDDSLLSGLDTDDELTQYSEDEE